MEGLKPLEYVPFTSSINPGFWHRLTEIKIDVDRLCQESREIWGCFTNLNAPNLPCVLEVDSTSFNKNRPVQNTYHAARGMILNKNLLGDFKDCDKTEVINSEGRKLWERLKSCELFDPSLISSFFILSFADLKKYHYYYWFCFPAFSKIPTYLIAAKPISTLLNESMIQQLYEGYSKLEIEQRAFFICKIDANDSSEVEVYKLEKLEKIEEENCFYFAFADPSTSANPGWPLRNYILFLLHHYRFLEGKEINVLAFRLSRGTKVPCDNSWIFRVKLPKLETSVDDLLDANMVENSLWVGWERNERGKFGPRLANMKTSIDPKCLADSAADLNLKLMKWQLLPEIDLDQIKFSKCLLLGAGTLGCAVARNLLAWGVRNITLVDNSTVSFSNPVRQSLYTYEDCTKSVPKALAAASRLKQIFPGINSKGFNLTIPMPGHPVGDSVLEQTKESLSCLVSLVSNHDVIFLLLDSREARWLPTLLGAYHKKIVINAALGFDTYLVMRHGCRNKNLERTPTSNSIRKGLKVITGNNLGCYFCNDVTAPGNSTKGRTLDQQCTVTRPGVSSIAGALAAELAISILQHKNGAGASAFYSETKESEPTEEIEEGVLGILPHSIRGFLSNFSQVLPATERYNQCVACSDAVLNAYENENVDFLLKVFDSCKYLEDLTGLSELQNQMVDLEVWDFDEDEEDVCSTN